MSVDPAGYLVPGTRLDDPAPGRSLTARALGGLAVALGGLAIGVVGSGAALYCLGAAIVTLGLWPL